MSGGASPLPTRRRYLQRAPLLALATLALLAGLWAGLLRLGWPGDLSITWCPGGPAFSF